MAGASWPGASWPGASWPACLVAPVPHGPMRSSAAACIAVERSSGQPTAAMRAWRAPHQSPWPPRRRLAVSCVAIGAAERGENVRTPQLRVERAADLTEHHTCLGEHAAKVSAGEEPPKTASRSRSRDIASRLVSRFRIHAGHPATAADPAAAIFGEYYAAPAGTLRPGRHRRTRREKGGGKAGNNGRGPSDQAGTMTPGVGRQTRQAP